ncbi:MAG: DUF4261 domain-containing protein [Pirellulaceae bacterium]
MDQEMMICIPGPWKDRKEFVQRVAVHTRGDFLFAGGILANPKTKDHVLVEFEEANTDMRRAFEIAGQQKLPESILNLIATHNSTVYLRFPLDVIGQRDRLLKFTNLVRDIGGIAVKVESAGIAHTWEVWQSLLSSQNPFDQYRCFVVLIGDEEYYYSCGMHHFGIPDCQVSRQVPMAEAADTMNRFNYYQIVERPVLASGHTFSVTTESPFYRLSLIADHRHDKDDLFWNPKGLWDMEKVEPGVVADAPGARG